MHYDEAKKIGPYVLATLADPKDKALRSTAVDGPEEAKAVAASLIETNLKLTKLLSLFHPAWITRGNILSDPIHEYVLYSDRQQPAAPAPNFKAIQNLEK